MTMPRSLPAFLMLLFVSLALGCGGGGGPTDPGNGDDGGDNPPPANEAPTANLSASEDEGLAPLETTVELTCSDPDGSIAEYRLDTDGDGAFEIVQSSAITETLTVEEDVSVGGQCTDDDGADSPVDELSLEVLQPATLTVHLRNLTQDGEPFVRGEGEITYTVGGETLTSMDSVVLEVDPRDDPEVWATHDALYDPWGLIKDDGQGKFEHRAYRDVQETSSTVSVSEGETLRLFVYKIRRTDITSTEDFEGNHHTIEDVATVIDNPSRISQGTDRYVVRSIPLWINEAESDSIPESGEDAVRHWASTENRREGARGLTDGFVQSIPMSIGNEEPAGPHYEVRFVDRNTHGEAVENNEIYKSIINLRSDFQYPAFGTPTLLEELGQGLGLRDDLPERDLFFDFTQQSNQEGVDREYNDFGLRLGKILYWFPPGTHFHQE